MKGFPLALDEAVRAGNVYGRFRVDVGGPAGLPCLVTLTATGAAIAFGTKVLSGLPVGFLNIAEVNANLRFVAQDANLIATWSGDFALGSAPTADNTLAGSEVDIVASTAIGPATAGAVAASGVGIAGGGPVRLDNTGGTLELNLNLLADAASAVDDTSPVVAVTGYIDLLMGWV